MPAPPQTPRRRIADAIWKSIDITMADALAAADAVLEIGWEAPAVGAPIDDADAGGGFGTRELAR